MNLVLDEAIEITKAGDKNQIGMIVLRGNSVVMLEAKDRLWKSTGLSWSVDNFWWKLPLKAFCPIFLSFCNKKHVIEELLWPSSSFQFHLFSIFREIVLALKTHFSFYNFYLVKVEIFRETEIISLLKTHIFLVSSKSSVKMESLKNIWLGRIHEITVKTFWREDDEIVEWKERLEEELSQSLKPTPRCRRENGT